MFKNEKILLKESKVLVSVLLPVYNTKEEYLRECIESILNQTFKNFELIIINDGSTNNAEEVILSYKSEKIKYYKRENQGITKVRNELISYARGKYIAIADHDDISLPYRLEKEVYFLENNPDISLVSGWIEVFPRKKIWKTKKIVKYFDMLKRCEIIHPACMWRKDDFIKYNLKYEDEYVVAQDYALFAKAVRYLKCANIQEVLIKYRLHENNASKRKGLMSQETEIIQNKMIDFLTSENIEKKKLWKLTETKTSFLQKIFSIYNDRTNKIIRIANIKIKIKRFQTSQ